MAKKTIDKVLDRFQAAASDRHAGRVRDQEVADIKALMLMEEGRRFVHRFLVKSHCFSTIFTNDALHLAHNAGWQDAGFFVSEETSNNAPFQYALMLKEALNKQERVVFEILEEAELLRKAAVQAGDVDDQ